MREAGRVLRLEGDIAIVEVPRSSACAECRACVIGQKGERILAKARNIAKAKVGDRVGVEVESKTTLLAAAIVYLIPILFLFLGYFLGSFFGLNLGVNRETFGIVLGFSLLVLAYGVIFVLDKRLQLTYRFEPVVTQVYQNG